MDRTAVGDIDNDGITELCTWWKEEWNSDDAYILIYKSVGDDTWELFMEEPFSSGTTASPMISQMLITDIDQNGLKEIMFTNLYAFFWEFSEPGDYHEYRSDFSFARGVTEVKVSDVDNDGLFELATVGYGTSANPPTHYYICEYSGKTSTYMFLNSIASKFVWWISTTIDVGDFDNDGVGDYVPGGPGYVTSYDPIDLYYLRYDTTGFGNFTEESIYTGLPCFCSTPVIGDFDCDGENELFIGGGSVNTPETYLWNPLGLNIGEVTWIDTISIPELPFRASFGYIDYQPSVVLTSDPYPYGIISVFGGDGQDFGHLWNSEFQMMERYRDVIIYDCDHDLKMEIILPSD